LTKEGPSYRRPVFVLDGVPQGNFDMCHDPYQDDPFTDQWVYMLSINEIDRVIIHQDLCFQGTRSIICIFTSPDKRPSVDLSSISQSFQGYYQAKEFYAPKHRNNDPNKYKPDLRTVIHWEPNIVTNEKGEATVTYYNADPKTTVNINVEGISSEGVLFSKWVNYIVK
jgi:hypothetical protein